MWPQRPHQSRDKRTLVRRHGPAVIVRTLGLLARAECPVKDSRESVSSRQQPGPHVVAASRLVVLMPRGARQAPRCSCRGDIPPASAVCTSAAPERFRTAGIGNGRAQSAVRCRPAHQGRTTRTHEASGSPSRWNRTVALPAVDHLARVLPAGCVVVVAAGLRRRDDAGAKEPYEEAQRSPRSSRARIGKRGKV